MWCLIRSPAREYTHASSFRHSKYIYLTFHLCIGFSQVLKPSAPSVVTFTVSHSVCLYLPELIGDVARRGWISSTTTTFNIFQWKYAPILVQRLSRLLQVGSETIFADLHRVYCICFLKIHLFDWEKKWAIYHPARPGRLEPPSFSKPYLPIPY